MPSELRANLRHRCVQILGVPADLGAGRRGVDMGPSAIRYARLAQAIHALGLECKDLGNVHVPLPESSESPDVQLRHLDPIVDMCRHVRDEVRATLGAACLPLVLGGDHSLSVGTLAAVCATLERPGVLWIDAHGDFNTPETSPSGNIHGMSLAVSTGRGAAALLSLFEHNRFVDPRRVALIGVRQLDDGEKKLLKEAGVNVFTMTEIDRLGIQAVAQKALQRISRDSDGVHISFDMDALNPDIAPGVGTPVEGGLSYREAHFLMEFLAESGVMRCLEVVEVNPILDDRNRSAELAVELIASALGNRIF